MGRAWQASRRRPGRRRGSALIWGCGRRNVPAVDVDRPSLLGFELRIWAIAGAVWFVSLVLYLTVPPSMDQWFYEYTGQLWVQGATPYVTFVDGSWPLCHWLHGFSYGLFGPTVWGWRLFDGLLLLLCTVFGADLLRRTFGRWAGVWFLLLYPALYVGFGYWTAGQRDIIAANLLGVGLWAYWVGLESRRLQLQVLTGATITAAALLKPPFALFGLVLAAHLAGTVLAGRWPWRRGLFHIAAAGIASVAFLFGAVGILLAQGVPSSDLFDYCFRLATARVNEDNGGLAAIALKGVDMWLGRWVPLIGFAVVSAGIVACSDARRKGPELGLWAALFAIGIISFFMQLKGLGYTIAPTTVPVIALISIGMGVVTPIAVETPGWKRWATVLFIASVWLVVGRKWQRLVTDNQTFGQYAGWVRGEPLAERLPRSSPFQVGDGLTLRQAVELSERLRSEVPPGGTILVWGRANVINVLTERPQPTRFFHNVMLLAPGRPPDLTEKFDAWFEADIRAAKPEMALVNQVELEQQYRDFESDSVRFLRDHLDRHYRVVDEVGQSKLYRRVRARAGTDTDDSPEGPRAGPVPEAPWPD